MKVHFHKPGRRERGYVLLVLLLTVALLSIALLTAAQSLAFQLRRDREEELIHRGVQYSRAVRLFVLKFHRYPGSIAELENTNNIRFLRKRYKDPITGKDFQLLYMDKVAAFRRPTVAQQPASEPQETKPDTTTPEYAQYAAEESVRQAEAYGQPLGQGDTSASAAGNGPLAPSPASVAAGSPIEVPDKADEAPPLKGVPIVGVASLSHKETIREFDNQNHYNQWLFIFNPNSPTSATGLIKTPDQPPRLSTAQAQNLQDENSPLSAGIALDPLNANNSPSAFQGPAK